ncbi:hypothetical protein [Vallitalea okinawensis]|uniref:hypothetical protein n=1 Tax=Vallitalea okinawensis TaxID=2078660 RepID=UPI000CFC7860|nr:hypothetical protein [Vallitalea okinawensis]
MIQLIKYEIIKKYKSLLILLSVFGLMSLYTLYLFVDGEVEGALIGFSIYLLLGGVLVIYLLVNNILLFSSDLRRKTGYMVFLTPNNGYKILGSKVLATVIENAVFIILYALIGLFFTVTFLNIVEEPLGALGISQYIQIDYTVNDFLTILFICMTIALGWLNFMLTITLAITLFKSLLAHVRYGGLISFGFFLVINYLVNRVYSIAQGLYSTNEFMFEDILEGTWMYNMGYECLTYLIVGAGLFTATAYLMDKKINL